MEWLLSTLPPATAHMTGMTVRSTTGGDVMPYEGRNPPPAPPPPAPPAPRPGPRGLHSYTSQLNLSTLNGIGGARRDCVARVTGVFRV